MELCSSEEYPLEDIGTTEVAHTHAMDDGRRSRPLKVVGIIQDTEVCVLIDTGSDRDFLPPKITDSLHLPLSPIRPFRVFVGNGEALLCTHVSRQTKLEVHILPIHDPNVILGMDWLESLGKVTADFAGKTLEFKQGDTPIVLKGILPSPRQISLHSLASLLPTASNLECFEILILEPETATSTVTGGDAFPLDLAPGVAAMLETYRPVFNILSGMPPQRPYDHRVHLIPGTKPINVKPYRYPYFQKNEIE